MNIVFVNLVNNDIVKRIYPDSFIISKKEDLSYNLLKQINPDYVFVPVWHWKISNDIISDFNVIGFHMTDLPFGTGSKPFEFLINHNIIDTKITAFKLNNEYDSGEIIMKIPFSICKENKEFTMMNAVNLILSKMIPEIIKRDKKTWDNLNVRDVELLLLLILFGLVIYVLIVFGKNIINRRDKTQW